MREKVVKFLSVRARGRLYDMARMTKGRDIETW